MKIKKTKSEIPNSHFYHFGGKFIGCYGKSHFISKKSACLSLDDSCVILTLKRKEAAELLRDWRKKSKA